MNASELIDCLLESLNPWIATRMTRIEMNAEQLIEALLFEGQSWSFDATRNPKQVQKKIHDLADKYKGRLFSVDQGPNIDERNIELELDSKDDENPVNKSWLRELDSLISRETSRDSDDDED